MRKKGKLIFRMFILMCCLSGCMTSAGVHKEKETENSLERIRDHEFAAGDRNGERFYEITQHPFPTFWGGEAYSILTPEGDLYLIDGGFQGEDGDRIAQLIEAHGGRVKAWILTHPHVDHIGAFIDYMKENSDKVEKVYYSPFTREFFEKEEDPEIYAVLNNPNAILFYEFLETMEATKDHVEYLPMQTGDIVELGELRLECFASFSPKRHDVNANSLVFTLSYEDFVMLFTGDMTEETLSDMQAETPQDALLWKADILQIPHHGYMAGIAGDELYRATTPKYALLDCTKEEYENNSVNIQNHVQMVENLEIEVLKRFDTKEGTKIRIYVP